MANCHLHSTFFSKVTREEQWGTTGTTGASIVGGVLTVAGGIVDQTIAMIVIFFLHQALSQLLQ